MRYRVLVFLVLLKVQVLWAQLPNGFVYVNQHIPSIQNELRYCTHNNFVGQPIDGYEKPVIILTNQATQSLKRVQNELKAHNLSLKVFDAYRPQRAVNHFKQWAQNLSDTLMKPYYYPNVDKRDLFKLEYIATHSRHSSGSTVDVTLVDLKTGKELDMGSAYDFFGRESWVDYQHITPQQQANWLLLQTLMNKYGFRSYPKEWWHFTLKNELFKNKYFDFLVR